MNIVTTMTPWCKNKDLVNSEFKIEFLLDLLKRFLNAINFESLVPRKGQRSKSCHELLPDNEGWELSLLDIESVELDTASTIDNKYKTLEPHAMKEEAQKLNAKFRNFTKDFEAASDVSEPSAFADPGLKITNSSGHESLFDSQAGNHTVHKKHEVGCNSDPGWEESSKAKWSSGKTQEPRCRCRKIVLGRWQQLARSTLIHQRLCVIGSGICQPWTPVRQVKRSMTFMDLFFNLS